MKNDMIKSMTGYGRAQMKIEERTYLVEVKSVNHRYFDFSCRVPRGYGFLEDKLKSACQSRIQRGKIDIFVAVVSDESNEVDIKINKHVLENYLSALNEVRDEYHLTDDISVMQITRLPDVFMTEKKEENQEEILRDVLTVADEALGDFIIMRENEGRNLHEDLTMRGEALQSIAGDILAHAPMIEAEYQKKLEQKIVEILGNADYDRQRLMMEVAIYADKVSITEELVRLQSHIKEFYHLLADAVPVGRKLDFLIQEMNREANTIGSKCSFIEITKKVVELKSELEKIREQIQNIE